LGALRGSGAAARLVGPLGSSYLFDRDLTAWCFGAVGIGLLLMLCLFVASARITGQVLDAQALADARNRSLHTTPSEADPLLDDRKQALLPRSNIN
jgi:hypothetical protein